MTGEKLSSIYVANMENISCLVRLSRRGRGDGIKGVIVFIATHKIHYMIICCKIQVIINSFLYKIYLILSDIIIRLLS